MRINEKATEYEFKMGRKPRYVVMDKKSFYALCESFRAKERKKATELFFEREEDSAPTIVSMNLVGVSLQFLPVDTDETILEVIG